MTPLIRNSRRGLTVVELIVASVIGVMVVGATLSSVSALLRVRTRSTARQEAFARADAAASLIALDLVSTTRSEDLANCMVLITSGGSSPFESDELLLMSTAIKPVRGEDDGPEGEVYEVQYRLAAAGKATAMWRRCDPGMDDYPDAGGIAAPVTLGVRSLSFQAYDGTNWLDDWNSDVDGLPHAVRVAVVAASDDGQAVATVRRVVAIDRVPIPPETVDTSQQPASGGTAGAGRTGTTGGGGR